MSSRAHQSPPACSGACADRRPDPLETCAAGFTLIETLIAMFILTFGLLATGQLIFAAMTSNSLARAKGSAAIVAQDRMEMLSDLYRQNSADSNLTTGSHGPVQVAVTNPVDSSILNRYNVAWTVAPVVTNGKTLKALQVIVTATPIASTGTTTNLRTRLNKVVSISFVLSARAS